MDSFLFCLFLVRKSYLFFSPKDNFCDFSGFKVIYVTDSSSHSKVGIHMYILQLKKLKLIEVTIPVTCKAWSCNLSPDETSWHNAEAHFCVLAHWGTLFPDHF